MNRPKFLHVGGILYWTIRTYNPDTQVLKDADSTPTVAIRKNGASTGDSVTVTKRSATTGIYDCSYNPAGEVEGDEFTVEETATVTGTTTTQQTYSTSWEFTVIAVERGTDGANTTAPANSTIADISSRIPAALEGGRIAAALDSAVAAQITAIETFATRITTGIIQDGPVWQFTANMLELAPSGTGVDELLALQEEILDAINGYISGLTALAVESPGSVTGFPESLRIGDSYTDVLGRGIQIPIVDVNGNPISSVGSKNFADAEATFVIKRFSDTEPLRIINGTALFVDPPGTGTSAGETPYALIEIPSSETAKGLVKYKYTGLLTFTWPYVGTGTDAEVMTFETGTITFET